MSLVIDDMARAMCALAGEEADEWHLFRPLARAAWTVVAARLRVIVGDDDDEAGRRASELLEKDPGPS